MMDCRGWGSGSNEGRGAKVEGRLILPRPRSAPLTSHFMKILVANLGSTSLKWRLFDFSDGREQLLHKGGIERVSDYASAVDECLGQLKGGGHIQKESDLAAVGFKTIMARGLNGCLRIDEGVVKAMEVCNPIAPAH